MEQCNAGMTAADGVEEDVPTFVKLEWQQLVRLLHRRRPGVKRRLAMGVSGVRGASLAREAGDLRRGQVVAR